MVKKNILTSLVFRSNTLNVLTRSHLSSHLLMVLEKLKPTPNKTSLAVQSKYVYMTQEAIKTRKQAKQNYDNSLTSSKQVYPKRISKVDAKQTRLRRVKSGSGT